MPDPISMLVTGRLAVDRSVRGHGVGAGLLKDANCLLAGRVDEADALCFAGRPILLSQARRDRLGF
jgi:predicted N-acetyltransferase YhbS